MAAEDGAVRGFLDHLAWERGLSPNTLAAYGNDLARLSGYLRRRRGGPAEGAPRAGTDWGAVTTADLRGFFENEAAERRFSAATRSRRLAALKGFFAFLREEGRIPENPAASLSMPRKPRNLPHSLTEGEVATLVESPPDSTPEGMRDRALLELVYGCGLRVGEAACMTLDALKFDAGLVRVLGKGSKVRHVPLGTRAEAALRRYLAEARPKLGPAPGEGALFLGPRGRPLGRRDIWAMLKKRAAACGVDAAVSPHWLRHSFATHMLQRGAPVRVIQELLGHADISTTQIYTHTDATRLASAVRSCHPRA